MRRSPCLLATLLILSFVALPAALAAPIAELPHRYLPGTLDHGLVIAASPDGSTSWAAWTYRNGAEFDIALAVAGEDGSWSEPLLLGERDGADQSHPTLLADPVGGFYLVYEDSRGAILLSTRPAGARSWSMPVVLSEPGLVAEQSLARIVGDRLVVAYIASGLLRLVDLPLTGEVVRGRGLNDGPDPIDNEREGDENQRRKKRDHDRGATLHPIDTSVAADLTLLPSLGSGRQVPDLP